MSGSNGRRPEKPADKTPAPPSRTRRRSRPAGAKISSAGEATLPAPELPASTDISPARAHAPADVRFSRLAIARAAYTAAKSTPGVAAVGITGGIGVRTYGLPGQVVEGVRVTQTSEGVEIEVHLTARLIPLPALAYQVRQAIARALPGQRLAIHVYVDALEDP